MKIVNRTRGTLLGDRIEVADRWWSRLRGFLGRGAPSQGEGMLLAPCNAIHTYGMRGSLDVLFLSSRGTVVATVERLAPWRHQGPVRGARYVLEVPPGTIAATQTESGDELSWIPRAAKRVAVGPTGWIGAEAGAPPRSARHEEERWTRI